VDSTSCMHMSLSNKTPSGDLGPYSMFVALPRPNSGPSSVNDPPLATCLEQAVSGTLDDCAQQRVLLLKNQPPQLNPATNSGCLGGCDTARCGINGSAAQHGGSGYACDNLTVCACECMHQNT